MRILSHTPLRFPQHNNVSTAPRAVVAKEMEPVIQHGPPREIPHEKLEEAPAEKTVSETEKLEEKEEAVVEVIPEEVEVDEELEEAGVEEVTHSTFFAGSRQIQLPMPIEELEAASHDPFTSGRRWLAEFIKFILKKFHKTIRRIGGVLQILDSS